MRGDGVAIVAGVPDAELDAVREILAEYSALPHNAGRSVGTEAELAGLPAPYVPPAGDVLTARTGSRFVGCVVLASLDPPDVCEMKRLYVRAEARGAGVGRRLVDAIRPRHHPTARRRSSSQ